MKITRLFLLFAAVFFGSTGMSRQPPKNTGAITLQWDAVTDTRVTSIRIYYGAQTHLYDGFFSASATDTQATLSGLTPGEQYYFAAAAHSDEMGDGQLSREVTWHLTGNPKPATGQLEIETSP